MTREGAAEAALFAGPAEDPDRYELVGPGLAGGEGVTWRARYRGRLRTPLPLAVKMLRRPPSAGPDWPTAADRQGWRDRTAILRHVRSDHVVPLHDVFSGPPPHGPGTADAAEPQVAYLEMEWIDGPTLHAAVAATPVTARTLPERLRHIVQAADALAALRSVTRTGGNPALHRDVSPANCILHEQRGLVLVDLSTLRLVDDGADPLGRHTPPYTAPEVLREPRLPRAAGSEVYSLGALAYFCLTGEDPPPADHPDAVARIAAGVRAAARAAGVPAADAVADHLVSAMAPDPVDRPTDVRHWAARLTGLASARAPRASRRRRTAGVAGVLAAAAGVVAVWSAGMLPGTGSADRADPGPTAAVPTAATARNAAGATPDGARPSGTIVSPPPGSRVRSCSYFSGTATLPPGTTLILAMSNLENGNDRRYVEKVFGWDRPRTQWSWRGAQYFGTDGTAGQDYQVELMAVDLRVMTRAFEQDDLDPLVDQGVVLDRRTVVRTRGDVPNDCVGPPS